MPAVAAAMAAMAGHRIVDRRVAASGATEYRMRKGLVSDPLRENPEDDHWVIATSLPAEQVAAAEEWLGAPQAPFEKSAAAAEEEEGRRSRRPESKPLVDELKMESVPEYNPTPAQFADPLAYVQTIYDQAALYGVCIINPPAESWAPTVGPADWPKGKSFAVKKQKMLNAQRKSGDPGFDYLSNELDLENYEKETQKFQDRVKETLPRPIDLDDEGDVETAFFDTMARAAGNQTVIYGNDVEGTLLEGDEAVKDNPWAPMRISLHADSPIRALGDQCPGITTPYMYFGMFFTFFCWHTEDNDLYSINYMIGGKPKTWFSVPDHGAEGFEKVLKETYPDFHERMPDLQYRKCLMVPPHKLQEAKVPVYRAVQRKNQIVITFPRGYHGGFSHGFNYAESSNFALPTWLEYGSRSAELYREASVEVKQKAHQKDKRLVPGRDTVVGMDQLLWDICVDQAAATDRLGATVYSDNCKQVARQELAKRLRRELKDRARMKAHSEAATTIIDNEAEAAAASPVGAAAAVPAAGEAPMDVSDGGGSTADEAEAEAAEYQVESVVKQRTKGGVKEYYVKWVGYSDAENTWEPVENLGNSTELIEEFEAKQKAQATEKKRKRPDKKGAAEQKQEEAPAMQSMRQANATEGDDASGWDLREEPCHICRHPCFYTLIRSSHPGAFQHPEPAAEPEESAEAEAADSSGAAAAGAAEDEEGAVSAPVERMGQVAAQSLSTAEDPIPLVSCLSPCCLSKLPGTLEQFEILHFYTDEDLEANLKQCEADCGEQEALPSFHGEDKLQVNPVKKKFFPRHEATIKKDPECQRKLAEWWADKMSGGDVQKTFVDKEEKIRLAEHVGLTERKIDYWLWSQRKKERKEPGFWKASAPKKGKAKGKAKKKAKTKA